MSLEQITKEFDFMMPWIKGKQHLFLEKNAVVVPRVSRLSLEALYLPLGDAIGDRKIKFYHDLVVLDKEGEPLPNYNVYADDGLEEKEMPNVGAQLLKTFSSLEDKEIAQEVAYVLYGYNKAKAELNRDEPFWWVQHREVIIFKMPKNKTFWQILRTFRKHTRQK